MGTDYTSYLADECIVWRIVASVYPIGGFVSTVAVGSRSVLAGVRRPIGMCEWHV